MPTKELLSQILYQALGEPIGLLIRTSDPARARQGLYRARQGLADPALAGLQIRTSPIEGGELIIINERIPVPGRGQLAITAGEGIDDL